MPPSRRNWLAGLALSPIAGAAALNAVRRPSGSISQPEPPSSEIGLSADERVRRRRLPNLELVTHEGEKVRFYDDLVRGRKVAINFMYTRCEKVCPPATRNLREVQKMLGGRVGQDIFFYSISLKPEEDTPDTLAAYAKRNKIGPGWRFLTGARSDIEQLRVALGFTDRDPTKDADPSSHLGIMRLVIEPMARWSHTSTMAPPKHIFRSMRFEFDSPTLRRPS